MNIISPVQSLKMRLFYSSLQGIFSPSTEKQCLDSAGIWCTLCGPPTTSTCPQLYRLTPKQQKVCFSPSHSFTFSPFLQKVTLLPSLIYCGLATLDGGLMFMHTPITSPIPQRATASILSLPLTIEPSADLQARLSAQPRGKEVLNEFVQSPTRTADEQPGFFSFLASYLTRNSMQTWPSMTGRLKKAVEWPWQPMMQLVLVTVRQGGLRMSFSREQGVVSSDRLHGIFYFLARIPLIIAEESYSGGLRDD